MMASREMARGRLLGMLQTPASRIASVLQAPASQLARVFSAYATKDAGDESGSPDDAAAA